MSEQPTPTKNVAAAKLTAADFARLRGAVLKSPVDIPGVTGAEMWSLTNAEWNDWLERVSGESDPDVQQAISIQCGLRNTDGSLIFAAAQVMQIVEWPRALRNLLDAEFDGCNGLGANERARRAGERIRKNFAATLTNGS